MEVVQEVEAKIEAEVESLVEQKAVTKAEPKGEVKDECIEEYPHGLVAFLIVTVGVLLSTTGATVYVLFGRKGASESQERYHETIDHPVEQTPQKSQLSLEAS